MQALVPIADASIGGASIPSVSARQLHERLGVGRDFSHWIKARIEKYGFQAGVDYAVFDAPKASCQRGGDRRSIEYYVSLDMAKELAMLEGNAQGRAVRRYFIDAEQELRAGQAGAPRALISELLLARPEWETIRRCVAADLTSEQIGLVLGWTKDKVLHHRRRMVALGLLESAARRAA